MLTYKQHFLQNLYVCLNYGRTKSQIPGSNFSLVIVIVIKTKPKYRFNSAVVLLFYSPQKKKLRIFYDLLLHYTTSQVCASTIFLPIVGS
jgi:hypothetical protein